MRKTRMIAATILLGGLLGGVGLSACQTGDTRTYEVHVWTADWETVVEPTCTEAGEARRYCSHCNDYKTKTLAPLGHDLEEYEAREATCTRNGWEAYEACMREGCGYSTYQEIGNLMHEYEGDVCIRCELRKPSEGLVYELNDGGTYSVTGIGSCEETNVVIASKYRGVDVTEIAPSAFEDCEQLIEIHISQNIQTIGANAFDKCKNLTQINIPASVRKIGENAFLGCYDLEYLEVEDVGAWCGITFEKNESSLYCYANPLYFTRGFYTDGELVKTLIVPDSVRKINNWAFYHCEAFQSARISGKVETIGENAFYDCRYLTSVTLGSGVLKLEKNAFYACKKLTEIICPDSIEEIGDYAFYNCKALTSVRLSEGLKTLGKNAFQNCSELTFNEYEGGRYLGTAENAYFALVEWRGAAPEEVTLHADVKVLFSGAVAEQKN